MKCGNHPKKFNLAGATWTVKYTDDIHELGRTDSDRHVIYISTKQTEQGMGLTMKHEVVHAILFTMGETDHDEKFVEAFAQLLYQYENQLQ